MSKWLSFNFIRVSIVYFLIGAFWMGLSEMLPAPKEEFAHEIYDLAMVHVMVLGWASFAIIGVLYHVVPKVAERDLHSMRLGKVHFWLTNISFPVGIFIYTWGSFIIDSLLAGGMTQEQVQTSSSILPLFITYIIALIVGLMAQFVFAYNIYKTMAAKS